MKNHCLRSLVTLVLNKRKTYLLSLLITFSYLISTRDVLNKRKMQSLYVIIEDNGLFCKISTLALQDLFIKYKKRFLCLIDGQFWTPKTIWHSGNKLTLKALPHTRPAWYVAPIVWSVSAAVLVECFPKLFYPFKKSYFVWFHSLS